MPYQAGSHHRDSRRDAPLREGETAVAPDLVNSGDRDFELSYHVCSLTGKIAQVGGAFFDLGAVIGHYSESLIGFARSGGFDLSHYVFLVKIDTQEPH